MISIVADEFAVMHDRWSAFAAELDTMLAGGDLPDFKKIDSSLSTADEIMRQLAELMRQRTTSGLDEDCIKKTAHLIYRYHSLAEKLHKLWLVCLSGKGRMRRR